MLREFGVFYTAVLRTVGKEYSKYRCVVKSGFQKESFRKEEVIMKKQQQH